MNSEADFDRRVRGAIAEAIRNRGVVPSIREVSNALAIDRSEVEASFRRMIDGRVFIPQERSIEILSYNPFAVDETSFKVTAAGRTWWAICAWDALGIPAALGAAGAIDARCGDCADPIRVEVGESGETTALAPAETGWSESSDVVMQVGIPARDFWKNIYTT